MEKGVAQPADLVIEARWVIPIEPADAVLERHAVVVSGGRVTAVLPADQVRRRFVAR